LFKHAEVLVGMSAACGLGEGLNFSLKSWCRKHQAESVK